jgi:Brp/Blh family beta-carotene 15,15'-monooxygenase
MIRKIQILIIAFFGIVFYFFPLFLDQYFQIISLFLILFIGVPHGAADHIIFERSGNSFFGAKKIWSFVLIYLLLGAAFLFMWAISPFKAMILFILISVFHFGQEHFEELEPSLDITKWTYFCWGSLVLMIPLVWNAETTALYFKEISGVELTPISMEIRIVILSIIYVLNVVTVFLIYKKGMIDLSRLKSELLQGVLLMFIFLVAPLVLGFAIYFVFWHSLNAMRDQYHFLENDSKTYSLYQYIKDIAPLSLVSIVFVLTCGYLLMQYSHQSLFSYIFILIALITLPHILLFDRFYLHKREMA